MSGLAALTLVRSGLKSIAPAWYPSLHEDLDPASAQSFSIAFELDCPKSVFS